MCSHAASSQMQATNRAAATLEKRLKGGLAPDKAQGRSVTALCWFNFGFQCSASDYRCVRLFFHSEK